MYAIQRRSGDTAAPNSDAIVAAIGIGVRFAAPAVTDNANTSPPYA